MPRGSSTGCGQRSRRPLATAQSGPRRSSGNCGRFRRRRRTRRPPPARSGSRRRFAKFSEAATSPAAASTNSRSPRNRRRSPSMTFSRRLATSPRRFEPYRITSHSLRSSWVARRGCSSASALRSRLRLRWRCLTFSTRRRRQSSGRSFLMKPCGSRKLSQKRQPTPSANSAMPLPGRGAGLGQTQAGSRLRRVSVVEAIAAKNLPNSLSSRQTLA